VPNGGYKEKQPKHSSQSIKQRDPLPSLHRINIKMQINKGQQLHSPSYNAIDAEPVALEIKGKGYTIKS
jgi:hypothetical protein